MERLIEDFLAKRKEDGLLRELKTSLMRSGGKIEFSKRLLTDFSSNDYLGLSGHPLLVEASKNAAERYGVSSCGSRLLSGNLSLHEELEEKTAKFKNKEAAIVFNSGYQANVGIISALYNPGDCIFADRLIHASLLDGSLLSGAKLFRFLHNDCNHLESLLKKERGKFKNCLIVTESLFSMDGDKAPLTELVALKNKYTAWLYIDEAHATGIYGSDGAGLVQANRLESEVDLIMGTFSKGLGSFGAYLAASKRIITYLINTCRSFIYSTSLPPTVIAANLASLELVRKEPQRRIKLLENAQYLRQKLADKGWKIKGESQIIPLIVGDNHRAVSYSKALQNQGYWVLPIRPPTVPNGQARLRFSLTYDHPKEILNKLYDDLQEIKI